MHSGRPRACAATTAVAVAVLCLAAVAQAAAPRPLPKGHDSWFWEIDPPRAGLRGLPPLRAAYPTPGSARIWDTDLFEDSNRSSGQALRIPSGRSAVVRALHATGHYAVCYVEVGAYQTGFPDDRKFAPADYGGRSPRHQMRGWPGEWWFDLAGFRHYVAGRASTLTGTARDIAAGLARRFRWCRLEGQDAVEPDDIESYDNRSASGARGGGWGNTRADELGFERWLAYRAHADGLAILQKNDPRDARLDVRLFDGALSEACNSYDDPCAGRDGDWDPYLRAHKPVLDAEYVQDNETTARFCRADRRWGIWGALLGVDLNGARPYSVCWGAPDALARSDTLRRSGASTAPPDLWTRRRPPPATTPTDRDTAITSSRGRRNIQNRYGINILVRAR